MSKHAFWRAFIFTVSIFGIGLMLGFFLEGVQSDNIYSRIIITELNLLDDQLTQEVIQDYNVSCVSSRNSLFDFADRIYFEAAEIEEIDSTGRLGDLTVLHKRYDLLRTLLLKEARNLKKRCGEDFHIVNYFYLYNSNDIEIKAKQNYFSKLLFDLKENNPETVLLVPIAADTDLSSVEILVNALDIRTYPSIVINDLIVFTEIPTLSELEEKLSLEKFA
ncbi:hypothetical protein EXS72_02900 [Candidatus Pacearchaeota archaeon]|nr:hypothetical protein [Candidatus Pacearchaeota archaeon]